MPKKKEKKLNIKPKKSNKITSEKQTKPIVWNPFNILESMDKWFWDDPWRPLWQRRWGSLTPQNFWPDRWSEIDMKPTAIDIIDTGKEFKVVAEMPGVSKQDLEVSITDNNISICGETKTEVKDENEGYIRRERSYSTLCRTMAFPEGVNPDKAEATLKDGILEVKVAKKSPTKGRNIPIK